MELEERLLREGAEYERDEDREEERLTLELEELLLREGAEYDREDEERGVLERTEEEREDEVLEGAEYDREDEERGVMERTEEEREDEVLLEELDLAEFELYLLIDDAEDLEGAV